MELSTALYHGIEYSEITANKSSFTQCMITSYRWSPQSTRSFREKHYWWLYATWAPCCHQIKICHWKYDNANVVPSLSHAASIHHGAMARKIFSRLQAICEGNRQTNSHPSQPWPLVTRSVDALSFVVPWIYDKVSSPIYRPGQISCHCHTPFWSCFICINNLLYLYSNCSAILFPRVNQHWFR